MGAGRFQQRGIGTVSCSDYASGKSGFQSRLSTYIDPLGVAGFQVFHFGPNATHETCRLYVAACSAGRYGVAEFWSEVLHVLYVLQNATPEGTVWNLMTPTIAAEAMVAAYGAKGAASTVRAACAEAAEARMDASGSFWSAALIWIEHGPPADPDYGGDVPRQKSCSQ